MKSLYTTIILTLLFSLSAGSIYAAEEINSESTISKKESKVKFSFGGTVDARFIYDSYKSYSARDGVIYFYPLAPSYDADGVDLNKEGTLNFSVFATRLHAKVEGFKVLGADANVMVETDFLGTSNSALQLMRIRLAYFQLNWEKDKLLIGQSNSLNFIPEVISGCVDFAGGLPYNTLNRAVQIRYDHKFNNYITASINAEMYDHHRSVGPEDAQIDAAIPAFHAQLLFGENSGKNVVGGITLGAKWLQPRRSYLGKDSEIYKTNKKIGSYSINSFLKFYAGDYKFQLYGIYGSNITTIGNIGGYGKLLSDSSDSDYGLTNLYSVSTWLDIESPVFHNFKVSMLMGYQANLGTTEKIDLTKNEDGTYKYSYLKDPNLKWFSKVAPRVSYLASKQLVFEIEYSFNSAAWAREIDNYVRSVGDFDITNNNRVLFRSYFKF